MGTVLGGDKDGKNAGDDLSGHIKPGHTGHTAKRLAGELLSSDRPSGHLYRHRFHQILLDMGFLSGQASGRVSKIAALSKWGSGSVLYGTDWKNVNEL